MSNFQNWFKSACSINALALLIALFLSVADNQAFLRAAYTVIDKTSSVGTDFKVALFICLPALFSLLLALFGSKYVFKPVVIVILLCASVVSYFMNTFGVIIDAPMIQNAVETDTKEVLELLNPRLFAYIALLGVLPAWLVFRCPITYKTWPKELLSRLLLISIAGVILGGTVFGYYKDFSLTMRQNRELRFLINPTYPFYALFKYSKQAFGSKTTLATLGTDAKRQPNSKPSLLIVVVGETARARSFSLNGYARETNPNLAKLDVINFPNAYSCGTATAESVPCMFSHLDKDNYTVDKAKQVENLLDVLKHAGINVLWLDNNSGCKGVCERVPTEALDKLQDKDFCNNDECFDEILLHNLAAKLANMTGDVVVVMHQKGSHGPAYFKRHPPSFAKFTPECATGQVQDCSQVDIANAYDNTILYTDYFLSKAIDFLTKNTGRYNTGLWYMSDHGESLGENGIYLHGLPYFLAPDEQIHIPFVVWLSPQLREALKIDQNCLKQRSSQRYSHDNLFHSVLGLMAVQTVSYQTSLDIFEACEQK